MTETDLRSIVENLHVRLAVIETKVDQLCSAKNPNFYPLIGVVLLQVFSVTVGLIGLFGLHVTGS